MRQNINLVLAAFWLAIAVGLLYLAQVDPDAPYLKLLGTNLSAVWLVFALVFYNLLRWWLIRKQVQARALQYSSRPQRRRVSHGDEPPNPDFDFSDTGAK